MVATWADAAASHQATTSSLLLISFHFIFEISSMLEVMAQGGCRT
jgi:hypothetical protein